MKKTKKPVWTLLTDGVETFEGNTYHEDLPEPEKSFDSHGVSFICRNETSDKKKAESETLVGVHHKRFEEDLRFRLMADCFMQVDPAKAIEQITVCAPAYAAENVTVSGSVDMDTLLQQLPEEVLEEA